MLPLDSIALTTADDCRAMARRVMRAIAAGEIVEDLLRSATVQPSAPKANATVTANWMANWQAAARARKRARASTAMYLTNQQISKVVAAVRSFADELADLPSAVDIPRIGFMSVRSTAQPSLAETPNAEGSPDNWASRITRGTESAHVMNEVGSALATLVAVRMRLDLATSRLSADHD